MSNRGEHAEIETFVGQTVDSELSGNMIDICPCGRFDQQAVSLQRARGNCRAAKSVSPHDSTGSNLIAGQEQSGDARGSAGE